MNRFWLCRDECSFCNWKICRYRIRCTVKNNQNINIAWNIKSETKTKAAQFWFRIRKLFYEKSCRRICENVCRENLLTQRFSSLSEFKPVLSPMFNDTKQESDNQCLCSRFPKLTYPRSSPCSQALAKLDVRSCRRLRFLFRHSIRGSQVHHRGRKCL
jgi:hypothetical protein